MRNPVITVSPGLGGDNAFVEFVSYGQSIQAQAGVDRKAIVIDEQIFEHNHPQLALYYFNLAQVEQDLENPNDAERLFYKALSIREESLPPGHPDTKKSYTFLVNLLLY